MSFRENVYTLPTVAHSTGSCDYYIDWRVYSGGWQTWNYRTGITREDAIISVLITLIFIILSSSYYLLSKIDDNFYLRAK